MADKKITELTELTTPLDTDILAIVSDPGGSPVTDKVTRQNLLKLVPAPAADHSASGLLAPLTAAQTTNFGDVCYIASSGKATLVDADAIVSSSGFVMCADAQIAADAAGNFLFLGFARDDTWAWTVGGLIYITVTATTGNTLSQTAPTGPDDVIQIVGVATHADRMFFNPQLVQVEHV